MLPFLRRKSRVLVLDDDAAMRRLMTLQLERAGYRVDSVNKGNLAIEAIAKGDYDAILLDLMMPHEGGMTVMAHLREQKPALLKRVVLVTGAPDAVLRSVQSDIAGVVHKPFDAEELADAVARVVASRVA